MSIITSGDVIATQARAQECIREFPTGSLATLVNTENNIGSMITINTKTDLAKWEILPPKQTQKPLTSFSGTK